MIDIELKKCIKPIIIDILTYFSITGLWLLFGYILNVKAKALNQGKSLEQLKFDIITNPDAAQAMIGSLKVVIGLLTVGTLVVITLTFIIYSYSRAKLWNSKYTKKWNLITLVTLAGFIVLFIIFLLIKVLLTADYPLVSKLILALILLIFLIWKFLNHHYLTNLKVAEAVSKTLKTNLKKAGLVLLSGLAVWVVISLVLSGIKKLFYWSLLTWPNWLMSTLQIMVIIILIAWFREFTVKKLGNS